MLNYTRYFNAGALLHNFQDAANLTKQLGIKNAIEYNVNDLRLEKIILLIRLIGFKTN